jgi:hypothetical protein
MRGAIGWIRGRVRKWRRRNFPAEAMLACKNAIAQAGAAVFYLVRITGVPRPRFKVRAALALFTAISRYPLEPI